MRVPKNLVNRIRSCETFFVTAHINLEADAVGSVVAFSSLLKYLGKKVTARLPDPVPKAYAFLQKNLPKTNIPLSKIDAFVILDCPNLNRIGPLKPKVEKYKEKIINIDHHISNKYFGDLNWVNPKSSSTGEMIYDLFKEFKLPFDKVPAEAIYSAIITDTGIFHYDNTTSKCLMIASQLKDKVNHADIVEKLFGNYSLSKIKLLGLILSHIHLTKDGTISWIEITNQMCKFTGCDMSQTEGFIDYARVIEGVKVAICFKQTDDANLTKVSFRSRTVDVNKVAKHFGGGGHKAASGCEVNLSFEKAKKQVIKKVKEAVKRPKTKDQRPKTKDQRQGNSIKQNKI